MLPNLEFDFTREARHGRWVALVLLVVGFGVAGDVARGYFSARSTLEELSTRIALLPPRTSLPADVVRTVTLAEWAAAREALGQLAIPWERLFTPLEAVIPRDVVLTSLEPDPPTRTVVITGDAKDYLSVLNYVEALRTAGSLRQARLTHHETNAVTRRINFAISASWAGS
jgi:Tfp pilus assembly protein PilN